MPDAVELVELADLLARDPAAGTAAVLDVLAGEPRIKPSAGLTIDPAGSVLRRWQARVAACRALLTSPAACAVFPELLDELTDSPEFAADVLRGLQASPALSAGQRRRLAQLG